MKLQEVPDKNFGFLGWERGVRENTVLISAVCVLVQRNSQTRYIVVTVTAPLDLDGLFWVEMGTVPTDSSHAIV
jgi:hypothetical protein